jgi:cytochrome b561
MLARMEPTFRYNAAQRALHWAMALIILVAIALGAWAATLPSGVPPRSELLYVHKSLGMLALVLLVVRVAVRALRGAPGWRVPLPKAIRRGAHAAHGSLYLLMLAMPVSGYALSGAGGHPIPFFGLFQWPVLIEKSKAMSEAARGAHYWLAWIMGAIVAVHVAAALWHHIVRKDETLLRMR